MSNLNKLIKLQHEVKNINNLTRHSNFQIVAGMCYDHVSPPIFSIPHNKTDELNSDQWDYVRFRTLQLLAEELIKSGCDGAIAEAGVFRGDFAQIMNTLFPQKKLYLFDTFSGFSKCAIESEIKSDLTSVTFHKIIPEFAKTSISTVIDKMPYPEKCIICEGLFSSSVVNLNNCFCLVSIDMDFYDATKEALIYFYPRIVKNGYILIHDYNHDELRGPKKAVDDFQKDNGSLCKVPIADQCGTLILVKS